MDLNYIMKSVSCSLLALLVSVSTAVASPAQEPADSSDLNIDPLISQMGLEPADSEYQQIISNSAANWGSAVDTSIFSRDEIDPVRMFDRGVEVPDMDLDKLGYMHSRMGPILPTAIAANTYVDQLFKKYASMRTASGIELPSEFGTLVHYIEGYIKQNSRPDTERKNGVSTLSTAVQIVRASFCFGNDPLMIVAKIRRETSFSRTEVSSGSAVGWSQMTGAGIKEVQDQMSGNSGISVANARSTFQQAVRCFTGLQNWSVPSGQRVAVQQRLSQSWAIDLMFGQIMMKAYVSYTRANSGFANTLTGNQDAYREAFVMYNGDSRQVNGRCVAGSTMLKNEYACDIISYYTRLAAQFSRLMTMAQGRNNS